MGLSGLNAHRKKYNFILHSTCMYCNYRQEDISHFLLVCPSFAAQRQRLLGGLTRDLPETVQPYINHNGKRNLMKAFTEILVKGTGVLNTDSIIFKHVYIYISDTNRFR